MFVSSSHWQYVHIKEINVFIIILCANIYLCDDNLSFLSGKKRIPEHEFLLSVEQSKNFWLVGFALL